MRLSSSCIVTISLLISCCSADAVNATNDRIINGDVSRKMAVGYLVSITQFGQHFCSGFIYNSRSVITAASCFEGKEDLFEVKVVINQYSLINQDPLEETLSIDWLTIQPAYDSSERFNDIAILTLSVELNFIPYADTTEMQPGPSCLKYAEVFPTQQTDIASFYGWGATEEGGLSALSLRSGKVFILSDEYCDATYGYGYQRSTMICGGNMQSEYTGSQTGPCRFDEGGPIVVGDNNSRELVALGIYSKSSYNCDPYNPSVYTRLSAYYAWINNLAGPPASFNCLTGQ